MQPDTFLYIGIDDTDNPHTRGTGFRARQLIEKLEQDGLARGISVTRHQLLVDDRVPYTSHNSSACLVVEPFKLNNVDNIIFCCRQFLLEIAAEGSDVGLCVSTTKQAKQVTGFGERAKVELLTQDEARETAASNDIRLEGLTGDHQGIIGAMSAVGLHVQGNDGRYLWPRDIREYAGDCISLEEILANRGIDTVTLSDGHVITDKNATIELTEWPRTVRIDGKAVLLVEQLDGQHEYKVLEKEIIKSIRP